MVARLSQDSWVVKIMHNTVNLLFRRQLSPDYLQNRDLFNALARFF